MRNPVTPHSVTRAQLDAAAVAARNEFYGADRGPEATSEWRWVVVAALNAIRQPHAVAVAAGRDAPREMSKGAGR